MDPGRLPFSLSLMDVGRGSSMRSRSSQPSQDLAQAHVNDKSRKHDLFTEKEQAAASEGAQQMLHRAAPVITRAELFLVGLLTLVALIVRFYHIERPSSVVFDEVHFGGFASKYLSRKFFMDVHPPLAKLLITLAAWLHGFRGDHSFREIGLEYLTAPDMEQVPYVAMRSVSALFATLTVPLAYFTVRGLSMRPTSALLAALLVIFDNALTTQSRFILLDAPLVFFVAASLCSWVYFCQLDARNAFSRRWWAMLALTGVCLGLGLSCKWVGLFTMASVAMAVAVQMWYHLGNLRLPVQTVARHVGARAVCLGVVPLVVYMLTFAVHFKVLSLPGDGESFMSWPFRQTLKDNSMPDTFADVALGSTVRIKHLNTLGGALHSHSHSYQTGSMQQQITLYPFMDENNEWIMILAPREDEYEKKEDGHTVTPDDEYTRFYHNITHVKDGDMVRFLHKQTMVRLHSHHNHRPPVSTGDYQNEVSGYGFPSERFGGDFNDNWVIEIYKQPRSVRSADKNRPITLRTIFRLRHAMLGCYLYSHNVRLPNWAYDQQEVTCNGSPPMENSLWYFETSEHPLQDAKTSPTINYERPGFLSKFLELNKVMWKVNNDIVDQHSYGSRPHQWPWMRRGINFWVKNHRQVYLIGNPMVWWSVLVSVLLYAGIRVLLILRAQRGYKDFTHTTVVQYDRICGFLAAAYAAHYVPFFLMKRQLFLHHYLPALYIGILLTAAVYDLLSSRLRPMVRLYVTLAMGAWALYEFSRYAPLTYASRWTNEACGSAIRLKTWDFNCVDFPDSKREYADFEPVVSHADGRGSADEDAILPFHLGHVLPQHILPQHLTWRAKPTGAYPEEKPAPSGTSDGDVPVPNVSGLDQSQRQQAVLEGTGALKIPAEEGVTSIRG